MQSTFQHHGVTTAKNIVETVITPLYEASNQALLSDPFFTAERFTERAYGYISSPGFGLVVAYIDDQPVAQAFGYTLPRNANWWQGLVTDQPAELFEETGNRTFALNEIMVVPEWEGKGIAHATHDKLMRSLSEERATLLVEDDNDRAQVAYKRWGYERVGKLQPFPDAPNFDAMILQLR